MEQRDAAVSHPIDLGTESFINSYQGRTTIMVNPCPHRDTTITETIMLKNTIGGRTSIMTSIYSGTSICYEHHEERLIGKENCSPPCTSPSNLFLTPPKSFSEVMCREKVASHRSPYLITVWDVIRLSSGIWLDLEVAVLKLPRRCINRMYRSWLECPWSVTSASCVVITYPKPVNSDSANLHMSDNTTLVRPCL